ncbi:MAG: biotin/lipoyl-binding protein [Ruminococcus flavefaciens]|nr:biotin/lipoyl-binding protein [Ruminococcus flavefaciens]MCM1060715.1 biotin/lipoyl-binding protein [Eubacterium sp.]
MNENTNIKENTSKINDKKKKDGDDYSPIRKREIIKTLIIIFLAAMLILTFFSNTIMNRSLSEITTETATSGKLTERIRGSGMIESNQSYEVTVDGNKIIDTINIKSGQEVKKDDVLFIVKSEESEELTAAETELAALELDYQKALLTEPVDYTEQNQAIKNAREDLTLAIEKRDAAYNNQAVSEEAKAQYNSDKAELRRLTSLQGKLTSTIAAIDSDEYSSAAPEYVGNLASLCSNYMNADSEYKAAYEIYSQAVAEGADEGVVASAKADADAKQSTRDSAKSDYDYAKNNTRNDLASQLYYTESDIENLTSSIEAYESSMDGSSMSYEDCVADVQAKQRALDDLMIALQKAQKTDNITGQISNLDLEAKKKEIEKQKKKVAKLKETATSTEVKSKYDGVVSSINVQPNDTTTPGSPLAVIDIAEEGYTVKISVDAEKSKKIKTGVKAEIVNNWSGNVEAVLTDIKNDTTAGSKNRFLIFSVTGDVDSGTSIDLSIPCGSGSYDAIIPKSAVYQDKDGSFVLTVKSKSSPFGNRYYAERVNVEVVASDEVSSAVQGGISQGDYVITAASKPVSSGDQVRMKDK